MFILQYPPAWAQCCPTLEVRLSADGHSLRSSLVLARGVGRVTWFGVSKITCWVFFFSHPLVPHPLSNHSGGGDNSISSCNGSPKGRKFFRVRSLPLQLEELYVAPKEWRNSPSPCFYSLSAFLLLCPKW